MIRRIIAAMIFSLGIVLPLRAAPLEIDLSSHAIEITPSFKGTELLLFGAVSGVTVQDVRSGDIDVVMAIKGPRRPIVVRKKDRILGLWINRDSRRFDNVPSYVAIASTRPMHEIAAQEESSAISVVSLEGILFDGVAQAAKSPDFADALVRLRNQMDLYSVQETGIRFVGDSLFRASVKFPAYVAIGDYRADVYLIRKGKVADVRTTPLSIDKSGFERLVYRAAHQDAPLYGLLCVLIAYFLGWIASVIFRRG